MNFELYSIYMICTVGFEIILITYGVNGFYKYIKKDLEIQRKSIETLSKRVDKLEDLIKRYDTKYRL